MNQGSMAAVMAAHAVGRSATAATNEADAPATVTASAIRSENNLLMTWDAVRRNCCATDGRCGLSVKIVVCCIRL